MRGNIISNKKGILKKAIATLIALFCLILFSSNYYSLQPDEFLKTGMKVALTPIFAQIYKADSEEAKRIYSSYYISTGSKPHENGAKDASFSLDQIKVLASTNNNLPVENVPFVFEDVDADYMVEMRERFGLDEIAAAAQSEYDAMLRVAAWAGSQWDHGLDMEKVPGERCCFKASDAVDAGRDGAKFWCEIAAKTMVQVATSMGWPARYVSASKTGYYWKKGGHAVAEVWSNEFNKWFVIDTDFNVVLEHNGIPLSAYELSHKPELKKSDLFKVRHFAPAKPSLPYSDIIPMFRYIYIDMRNDWVTRQLPRGSPAGGDLASWRTARDDMKPVLTSKVRVDNEDKFNWKINNVYIEILNVKKGSKGYEFSFGFSTYSPYFEVLLIAVDNDEFMKINPDRPFVFLFEPGVHIIKAQVRAERGSWGPVSSFKFKM